LTVTKPWLSRNSIPLSPWCIGLVYALKIGAESHGPGADRRALAAPDGEVEGIDSLLLEDLDSGRRCEPIDCQRHGLDLLDETCGCGVEVGGREEAVPRPPHYEVVTGLDDHFRLCVSAKVVARATARPVCDALAEAMRRYGVPENLLTDNGKVFTGRFGLNPNADVLFDGQAEPTNTTDIYGLPAPI
jgi:hypothetical protein